MSVNLQMSDVKKEDFLLADSVKTSPNISNELRLLLYALNATDEKQQKRLENFLAHTDIDWNDFIKLVVDRHRVTGPVYKNLIHYGKTLIPESVSGHLKRQYQQSAFKMLAMTTELVKITGIFDKHGIRALPFKGPVLGMQLLGDCCMRRSGDLDIVVPQESVPHAEELLMNSGYKKIKPQNQFSRKQYKSFIKKSVHSNFFNPDTQISVELHWKFFSDYICSVNFDSVWQNRQMIKIGQSQLPSCALDDTVILLLIHGGKHSWRRLFWVNDIFLILNTYTSNDFKRLMDRVEALGIKRLTSSAMILLETLFDFDLPESIHKMDRKDKIIPFLVQTSLFHITESDELNQKISFPFFKIKHMLSNFFLVSNSRYKALFFFKVLFPPDFGYLSLPDTFFFLYYPLRPFFWFFRKFTKIKPARMRQKANNPQNSSLCVKSPPCS